MRARNFFAVALASAFFAAVAVPRMGLAQSSSSDTTMGDVKKEMTDVAEVIKSYSADRKDEAIRQAGAALDQLDASIDELESSIERRSAQMTQATRQRAQEALEDLRERRKQVAEWYGGMRHSSRDAWDHVKQGFSESYSALHTAWDKAMKEFDGDA